MNLDEKQVDELIAKADKNAIWADYLFTKLSTIDNSSRWLKQLFEKGYFSPVSNPTPEKSKQGEGFIIPYWYVLGYLENVSRQNKIQPENQTTDLLLQITDAIIDYRSDGKRIDNFRTDVILLRILFNLPIERITIKHILFISTALHAKFGQEVISSEILKTCVPYLIANNAKPLLLELMKIILDFSKNPTSYFSGYNSLLGDYWLDELLTKHKNEIFRVCGLELYAIAIEKIEVIMKNNKDGEIFGAFTIEESSQNLKDDYLTQMIALMRDLLLNQPPQKIAPIVSNLINQPNSIMRRLAVFTISEKYDELKDIFWSQSTNPIEDIMLKHELYQLFKKNSCKLTDTQVEKIVMWIETEKRDYKRSGRSDEEAQKVLAYHKKEWLSSIEDTGNNQVVKLYEKYDKISTAELEHPGYLVWSSGVMMESPKPFDNKVMGKSNLEIAEFLAKETKVDELSDNFRTSVGDNPQKFSQDLDPFLTIPVIFQYSLLEGLTKAQRDKKELDWDQTLEYIRKLIVNEDFWSKQYEKTNYRVWISKEIANLIEEGVRNDAFKTQELVSTASDLLLLLAKHDNSEYNIDFSLDLITSVLNSPRGAIFMAIVNLALKYQKPSANNYWSGQIKDYFSEAIEKKIPPSTELYVTLGEYLINIYFILDRKWVNDNINLIFPKEEQDYWTAAFSSYLFSAARIYREIYDLLTLNGHYSKALNAKFNEVISKDRLANHIAIAYINEFEELDNPQSLIAQLLSKQEPELITPIVNLIWRSAEKLTEKQRIRSIQLWEKIVQSIQGRTNDPASRKALASLFQWINVIDELDSRTVNLLKVSLRNASSESEIMFVIEDLMKHVQSNPHEVAELFLELLLQGNYPYYPQDKVQSLVKTLYDKKEHEIANRICDLYWNKRYFFLRDIYDMNN